MINENYLEYPKLLNLTFELESKLNESKYIYTQKRKF